MPLDITEHACIGSPVPLAQVVAAVVVVAYNRLDYLQQCITSLLEMHGQDQANRWASTSCHSCVQQLKLCMAIASTAGDSA